MLGKDVFRRRRSQASLLGAATAILVMLCGRGSLARGTETSIFDLAYVDDKVTITVEGTAPNFQLKVVPEVFLIKKDELVDTTAQAAQAAGEVSRLMTRLASVLQREKKGQALAARAEEAAMKAKEMAAAAEKDAAALTEPARKAAASLVGGPGLSFEARALPPGFLLEINFGTQGNWKGPFLFGSTTPGRPVRGRYELTERAPQVASGQVDLAHFPDRSVWKYEVVLRDQVGRDVVAVDPMGVLK